MNLYDQILASAYYVFEEELTSQIIKSFVILLKKADVTIHRNELKMEEIAQYMEFKNHKYKLKDGYTIHTIADYINLDMVAIFHNLKKTRDEYYSNKITNGKLLVKSIGQKIK